LAVHMDVTVVI